MQSNAANKAMTLAKMIIKCEIVCRSHTSLNDIEARV